MRRKHPKIISINPVGSFFNFPNWRYLIYLDPSRANLPNCSRKPASGSQCLVRYMSTSDEIAENSTVNASLTINFQRILYKLPTKHRNLMFGMLKKKRRKNRDPKVFCNTYKDEKIKLWSGRAIGVITDAPLKRFLMHVTRLKQDRYIEHAVRMHNAAECRSEFVSIGYYIYAGLSDVEIAKRFRKFPKQITAIRELFFDFTNAPKDPVAKAAYFTQLADNKIISPIDRRYYKLVSETGEVGLRASANMFSLTPDEMSEMEQYLSTSTLDNIMTLNFSVSDTKDALAYNNVINSLASFYIKKEEAKYYRAKVRNLDAATQRILNERSDIDTSMDVEDRTAVELISRLALKENTLPQYKSITELE